MLRSRTARTWWEQVRETALPERLHRGRKPLVGPQVQHGQVRFLADALTAYNHSTPGEMGCYTEGGHRRSFLFQKCLTNNWIQENGADVTSLP